MSAIDPRIQQAAAVLAAGILVVASWQLGYTPARRADRRDRDRAASLGEELAQIEALVLAAGGEASWLSANQQRLEALRRRFPSQEQVPQLLNALIEGLKVPDEVKLVDVSQGNLEPILEGGEPLTVDGAPCYRLPVLVTAEGRYHAILSALTRVTAETFPAIVSVRQVELTLKETAGIRLSAVVQLYLYVKGAS